jgi:hypothetical protein
MRHPIYLGSFIGCLDELDPVLVGVDPVNPVLVGVDPVNPVNPVLVWKII